MKKLLNVRFVLLFFCLSLFSFSSFSKEIFVSTSGNDENTGLSKDKPFLTLTQALSICEDNDIINISGILDISKEASDVNGIELPDVRLSIIGEENLSSGFSGNGKYRIFSVSDNSQNILLKNLSFTKGNSSIEKGVAVYLKNAKMDFDNCMFYENTGNRRSSKGTIFFRGCKKCLFQILYFLRQ